MSLIGRAYSGEVFDLTSFSVLVTGATGFIGSHIIPKLVECGANVIAVAADYGWQPWITQLIENEKIKFIKADILTIEGVEQVVPLLADVDSIIHMARVWAQGNNKLELSIDEVNRNLLGSLRFLSGVANGVKRIIYPSSVEVYGVPEHLPLREDHPLQPVSPYAVAKVASEGFLKAHAAAEEISVTILRYSTIYGPAELDPRAIPNFIRAALLSTAPKINGTGLDIRDYVYIADVVDATLKALFIDKSGAHIYNIGSGVGCTTNDLAQLIIQLTKSTIEPIHQVSSRPTSKIVCDISKAKIELGYYPSYSLTNGLTDEIFWLKSNKGLWVNKS